MEEQKQRYTVHRAFLPQKTGEAYQSCLVLDNGLPALDVNKALIVKDKGYPRLSTTDHYHICAFLNYLDRAGIDYMDATMEQIHQFLVHTYSFENTSYGTLKKYIDVIGKLYETIAIIGKPLDPSLYIPMKGSTPKVIRNKRKDPLTKVWYLKNMFRPKKNMAWQTYTKWYTHEQVTAIADELPLVHRCIFLSTVYLGYRSSSALSIKMSTVDLREKHIKPTHSKTGQLHTSKMPDELALLIQSYIENERSRNPGNCSEWLFLNNRGGQMTYESYNSALKYAAEKVRKKHPELELGTVHTHAGRSTFAAALRSYQLRERRLGHKTLSDEDFCILMDWKSLQCLKDYDLATRIQEISPLLEGFYQQHKQILAETNYLYRQVK